MNLGSRFSASMNTMGKRLEVLRKKNEMNLLQNEIVTLESELRELEMLETEAREERPRRHLPDIPLGRRERITVREPPELHLFDESSIGVGAGANTSYRKSESNETRAGPVASTSSAPAPKPPQDSTTLSEHISPDKRGAKLKPATFDGTVHWTDYKAHFDACAELNGWTDKEKGLYLAVSMRGQAQGVFGNLASKSNDYAELSNALQERFAPPNQTDLYRVQLKERKQKATESLTEL